MAMISLRGRRDGPPPNGLAHSRTAHIDQESLRAEVSLQNRRDLGAAQRRRLQRCVGCQRGPWLYDDAILIKAIVGMRVGGWMLKAEQKGSTGNTAHALIAWKGLRPEDLLVEVRRSCNIGDG